ncbi:MAG: hypothetical protein RBS07_07645 [Lentimicrobium sp.]|jgi:hypothetical protein|nr:hypothetical protein [Lentimicrobium sp.]
MEKYQMKAEIERLQALADKLLNEVTADNIIESTRQRHHLLIKIDNMKKWLSPASTADRQMSYGVTYIGKTAL